MHFVSVFGTKAFLYRCPYCLPLFMIFGSGRLHTVILLDDWINVIVVDFNMSDDGTSVMYLTKCLCKPATSVRKNDLYQALQDSV